MEMVSIETIEEEILAWRSATRLMPYAKGWRGCI